MLKQTKERGEERSVNHKEAIDGEDMAKIQRYFEDVLVAGDAVKLSQYCWFNLSLHFALRAAEVQTRLKKCDIVFETGSDGKEYGTIRRDFMSKNCPGGIDGREFESCGRIQETHQVDRRL